MSELKKAEDLKETIKQTFEANPEETELSVTPDGNCFLARDKSFAEFHARRTNQKIEYVKREDFITNTAVDSTGTNDKKTKKTK